MEFTGKSLVIEKNIPLARPFADVSLPLRDMEVGDSFFVPSSLRSSESVRASVYNHARDHRRKYQTALLEEGEPGVRVWRTR